MLALSTTLSRPISPDALKVFQRCPKKFEYQRVHELHWPSDIRHFDLGQDVHKLMEYQARGLDCSMLLPDANPEVVWCYQQLMQTPAANWPVVASEWGFLVSVPDGIDEQTYWLSGRMDRLAWDPENEKLWVIDWKTGTAAPRFPESDWQTVVYLFALAKAYPDLRNSSKILPYAEVNLPVDLCLEQLGFLYLEVNPKKKERGCREIQVPYNAAKHFENQAQLITMLNRLNLAVSENDFPLPKQCPDPWCAYRSICGIADADELN